MANEFICWDCKRDGTRCDCHTKRPYHYTESLAEKMEKARIDNEIEINRLRKNLGLPLI
jgi:predicted ATPase with chaperone activity